jgi:hypothetical protein
MGGGYMENAMDSFFFKKESRLPMHQVLLIFDSFLTYEINSW